MFKVKIVLAATFLSVCGCANAQVSDTLQIYGRVDTFLEFVQSGSAKATRVEAGGSGASLLGFRGREQLGNGYSAQFILEAGINSDEGTVGDVTRFFTRGSSVGLTAPWGAVDLGRMWTSAFYVSQFTDVSLRNRTSVVSLLFPATDSQGGGVVGLSGLFDDAIRYQTPVWNGVRGEVMYTRGDGLRNTAASGRGLSASLTYTNGPLYLAYGFQRQNTSLAAATTVLARTVHHIVGGSYKWGPTTTYVSYHTNESDAVGTRDARNAQLGVRWNVSGPHTLLAQYAQRNVGSSANDARGIMVGYNYQFSKRTQLYVRHDRITNEAGANIAVNRFANPAAGVDPRTTAVGIRHEF